MDQVEPLRVRSDNWLASGSSHDPVRDRVRTLVCHARAPPRWPETNPARPHGRWRRGPATVDPGATNSTALVTTQATAGGGRNRPEKMLASDDSDLE